jgi:hypothetical protein
MLAYNALTNNDILQYITQWHILPFSEHDKIVNILSQDKNIIKLLWLLRDKYLTIEKLDELTKKYTTIEDYTFVKNNDEFFENMTFFDYIQITDSKNIIKYFAKDIKPTNINYKSEIDKLFGYTSLIIEYDAQNNNPFGFGMQLNNMQLHNLNSLCRFIVFYNNLPQNNILSDIILPLNLQNDDNIKKIIFEDMNLKCNNNSYKFCCFCCDTSRYDKNKNSSFCRDELVMFLLKSKSVTLEYFDNVLKTNINNETIQVNSILYFMYRGFNKTFKYIMSNYPSIVESLDESQIFKSQEVCDYFLYNNCDIIFNLIEKGMTSLYNNVISYFFECKLFNQSHDVLYKIKDFLKKMNVHPEIYTSYFEPGDCQKIQNFVEHNKLLYIDNIVKTIITYNNPEFISNFSELTIDHKNICIKYLLDNGKFKSLLQVLEYVSRPIDKLHILIENGKYDDAFEYICNGNYICNCNLNNKPVLDRKYNDGEYFPPNHYVPVTVNLITEAGQNIDTKITTICSISKDIVKLIKYIQENDLCDANDRIKIIYDKLKRTDFNVRFLDLVRENKLYKLDQICREAFTYDNRCNMFDDIVDSTSICYISNFEENFNKLNIELQNMCIEHLSKTNNFNLLSKIIFNKYVTFEFDVKLSVLLKYKLYNEAIKYINDNKNKYINNDTQFLLKYVYENESNDNIMSFLKLVFGNVNATDKIYILSQLPKSLENFCDIFVILCDMLGANHGTINFVNEYKLSQHLQYFVDKDYDNYIIKNIVIQNMLNIGKFVAPYKENKMVIMTPNIYKKNVKNINNVIENYVIRDHNMLTIMYNYKKVLPYCFDMDLVELEIFFRSIQHTSYINDDLIFNNFNFKNNPDKAVYLFEYFIQHNFKKCLKAFLNNIPSPLNITGDYKRFTYNKEHILMAKNSEILNILIGFNKYYTPTSSSIKLLPVYTNMCSIVYKQNLNIN